MTGALDVVELFTSVQGEGPHAGEPAVFLRLAHCNLACSWCDTPFSWDWVRFDREQEIERLSIADVVARIDEVAGAGIGLVVVTGGEPLLQQQALVDLISLDRSLRRYEVETNGTIAPTPPLIAAVALFVVSPKLANAGMSEARRLRISVLERFRTLSAVFKFVVEDVGDLPEIDRLVADTWMPAERVWLMPQGTTAAGLVAGLRALAGPAIERGYRLTDRLHIHLWGDARGR